MMFEFFRTHQKLMQFLLLLLILPAFVLVGLESYTRFNSTDDVIATVADKKILQQEFDAAKKQQLDRLRQMLGPQFDPKMFEGAETDKSLLDSLINEKLADWAVSNNRLGASDDNLRQIISSIPAVQENGKFSLERYKTVLAAQGLTPEVFQERLRGDVARSYVTQPLAGSEFLPKTVQDNLIALNESQRTVALMPIKLEDYFSKVTVTDEQITKYYQANKEKFRSTELADIEYVVLNGEDLAAKVSVSDADAKSYYDQNQTMYKVGEQRHARHILINANKDASADAKAKAKAKAEQLLAKLKANPAEFPALAKAESQDPGSAANGGDLGLFGRGAMVKPFEDAAFGLKKGEVSGVVQSDFGYHIIQVTDIKAEAVRSFDEVKAEIQSDIRKQQAPKLFAEAAETFTNLAYDQPDSLKPLIDKYKLEVVSAQGVQRTPLPGAAPGSPLASPEFLASLFVDDVIKNKHNSKAFTTGGSLVAGRMVRYQSAEIKTQADVAPKIKALLLREESQKVVKKEADTLLDNLRKGTVKAKFGAEKVVSRVKPLDLSPKEISAVFSVDAKKLPAYVAADLGLRGVVLVKISAESAAPTDAVGPANDQRQATIAQWQQSISQSVAQGALEELKTRAKVEIKKAKS